MVKSFAFVIFLLGFLIAQIACAKPSRSNSNKNTSSSTIENNAPWLLPGFDKTQITNLGRTGRKCWQNDAYRVCLARNNDGTKLFWKNFKFDSEVKITVNNNDEMITQEFDYNGGHLGLTQMEDGSSSQYWGFGKDKFDLNRYSDGTSKSQWVGTERPADMEKLKKFVNSWCENNDFFVGKESCVIYDKIKVNSAPAWILPGFDKNQVKQVKKNEKKCWTGHKYQVCLNKRDGTQVIWSNKESNVRVEIEVNNGGSIFQDFQFKDNHIQIEKYENDSMLQKWNVGSSKFELRKRSADDDELEEGEDMVTTKWYGKENPEALKKAQEFVDAWCANNDFFIKKEDCSIYKI